MSALLDQVLALELPAFAIIHRPESGSAGTLDVLTGQVTEYKSLDDIPLADGSGPGPALDTLVLVPYRQLADRGFAARDDATPLLAMSLTARDTVPVAEALAGFPQVPTELADGHFDVDDDAYAQMVRQIVTEEIGTGEGANFVMKRSFVADIGDYSLTSALSFFRRLVEREEKAYWTFIIHTGRNTLVGATPERHVSLVGGTAVMNPISGTYRYPSGGPSLHGVMEFLADTKETDELYMVLDEELKMMARLCDDGGRVHGPYLKEMARLAHTEYLIEGRTNRDVREVLHETMFAPTVTGSPLESAAKVISRYEPKGRGYYSGVAALIGRDAAGQQTLDSAILIRTADIDPGGRMNISVGATLVRHSDPMAEAAETHIKLATLLDALKSDRPSGYAADPEVRAALERRNEGIADFWQRDKDDRPSAGASLDGMTALVVDAEDTFTAMLDQQLRSLGLSVEVRRFDEPYDVAAYDLTVFGPGPGDPRMTSHPKIAKLRQSIDTALASRRPLLAVCLSHQVLSTKLDFELHRREVPNQGVQREIELFGLPERVGFYNTFAVHSAVSERTVEGIGVVEVSRDQETGEVNALRGPGFASMQFHAESVLTVDGPRIITEAIQGVLGR
ncbi:anthranilate synthase family protein [Streptomyces sp. NBC_00847]|uniref:anthranilate synthase family protein n=1 Tax=Streptomyces sp. NBC_00847 TaxID=2975850 RepID=UPI002256D953|nr:anthranilate synthase family protein [Streptomyces sp. NBC_00847]MCX4884033.1 anthranilate synthase family protein [Streptomyces sp. NBC_00847]